jgi:predicted exporter
LQPLRVAKRWRARHCAGMTRKSPLDDPATAAHAWARYRQIMKLLLAATTLTVAIAMVLLFAYNGMISVHFYIAVALGISFTMLLGGGLMGLAFLSNGTGHDESVDNKMPRADEFWSPQDD